MFPARAGMSLFAPFGGDARGRVPRASGDEPGALVTAWKTEECSPRERG